MLFEMSCSLKLLLLFMGLICHCFASQKPLTLLVSFDGFRYNYLERTDTPNFDKLISSGVKAKWIQDVFVSLTFPNHYTLATGLYEESHGVVANQFYDPQLRRHFNYRSPTDVGESVWWGGEPIWVTSELQGKHSGTFFWVGSEAKIKGVRPTQWMKYSMDYPWTKRVDGVVEWLANKPYGKEQKINNITLALLYFPQPDHDAHIFGPESAEVTERIRQCDNITGYLIDQLTKNSIFDDVNIIITSDHGFAALSQNKTIPILPHLNLKKVDIIINYGTGAGIWPKPGFVDLVYEELKDFNLHAKVRKANDIPSQFHYNSNDRIPPILIIPDDGWYLVNHTHDKLPMKGSHGYDNSLMDMHPFFIARGPAFRQGYVSEPFSSVNVYELICHIMGLKPAPNNGSLDNVKHLLKSSSNDILFPQETESSDKKSFYFDVMKVSGILFGATLGVMLILFIIVHFQQGRNKFAYGWLGSDEENCKMLDDKKFPAEISYQI